MCLSLASAMVPTQTPNTRYRSADNSPYLSGQNMKLLQRFEKGEHYRAVDEKGEETTVRGGKL